MKSSVLLQPIQFTTILLLAFGLVVAAGLSGCGLVAAGTGAGAVAYIEGTLDVNLGADYAKVVTATELAVKELEFKPVSEKKDALKAEFVAQSGLDKKVEINLTKAGDRVTKLDIHVGFFGDQQMSMAILEKIKKGL